MRIMALGDSLTDGWIDYSNTSKGGYRINLDAKLDAVGINADFVGSQHSGSFADNQHEGYPGQTIDWLIGKAHSVVPTYKPDIILLMAGANDTKTDSVATMKSDMSKLIDTLTHDAPNAEILVAAPPPPRPGNLTGHNVTVANEFNKALPGLVAQKAAAGAHVQFVDTSKITVNDISPIGIDRGTHLTQAGYNKLADIWFDAVKKVVSADQVADNDHPSTPSTPPTPSTPIPSTNHAVVAADDKYTMDAGKKLYFNSSHILMNDKGVDGGLKAVVAAKSANGVTLEKWADGTVVYKAGTANGTDKIDYVLTDKDGSTDTGSVLISIKNGVATSAPSTPSAPVTPPHTEPSTPSTGKGNPVIATDDSYKIDAGKTLYFNTRYLTVNDKGLDGGLNVVSVDAMSERGVKISWGPEGSKADGTLVYKAHAGFDGTDKITYKVADKDGSVDIGTVLIHVHDTIA
jgi:lysophospholipase L1-like esterase